MANCKNCGAEISPLDKTCPYCGMPQQAQGHDPFDETQAYIPNPGQSANGGHDLQPANGGHNNQPVNDYNGQSAGSGYNMYNGGGDGMGQKPAPMPVGGLIALSVITIFLCLAGGIVSLIMTLGVNKAMTYEEQQAKYASAKKWVIILLVVSIILNILAIIGRLAQNGVI